MPTLVPENSLAAVFYLLGYLTGVGAFAWLARRRGLSTAGVWLLALAGLFGGLLGANIGQWIGTGGQALGKTIVGGVAGGYLAVFLTKRAIGLRRPTGDLFAFGMSAGEAVGRWGCFVGGCCYGRECRLPWAIWQHGAWRHPTQVYLSAAALFTFAVLIWLERRGTLPENGLFYVQGTLFCALRFLIEFFRAGDPALLGLTAAQWTCAAGFAFFAVRLACVVRAPQNGRGAAVPERLPEPSGAVS